MAGTANPLYRQSVGEIAAQRPGASVVFRRFGIDFCCQCQASLEDSTNHRNLDLAEVEQALDALDPSAAPEAPQETAALR